VDLGRDELTVPDSELVEIAVDLAGPAGRDDDCREAIADLGDDLFDLHGILYGKGAATEYPINEQ